jgi:hypothetical protein
MTVPGLKNVGRLQVVVIALLIAVGLSACGQGKGRLVGNMYVPARLRGSAKWGEVWLLRNYRQVQQNLRPHWRILRLVLVGKDTEFLRVERRHISQLGVIKAKLEALNRNEIPLEVIMPREYRLNPFTTVDSLTAGIVLKTRPATSSEDATGELLKLKDELKETAKGIRRNMTQSVSTLRAQRLDQKRFFLDDADEMVRPYRITSTNVGMDGHFQMSGVTPGEYALYGRYILLSWFQITPITVVPGDVVKDIPRIPSIAQESRSLIEVETMVRIIDRM